MGPSISDSDELRAEINVTPLVDTPLPSDDLAVRLGTIYESRPDKTIMLAAARSLAYARVVEVMDACRAAGIERIGIRTRRELDALHP